MCSFGTSGKFRSPHTLGLEQPIKDLRGGALALLSFLVLAIAPTTASAEVYWSSYNSNEIGRANIDGSGINQSFITGASTPDGLAVDPGHLYWANWGGVNGATTIGRANIDGGGVDQSLITGNFVSDVAVDADHIYWTTGDLSGPNTIGRANIDGSGADQNFISIGSVPLGVAVDADYIYWTTFTGTIGRANLDGSGVDQSFITGLTNVNGVAVDADHIYWTIYAPFGNGDGGEIGRANLDGTGLDQSFIAGDFNPYRIAVDSGRIYWSNYDANTIGRAMIDGAAMDQSFIVGADHPAGVAVTPQPLADPSPASLAFGSPKPIPRGSVSAPQTVTYTNTGTAALSINGLATSGANADDFSADLEGCSGPLTPGESCMAEVRFTPQAKGLRSATLTAITDASEDPKTLLTGSAGPPQPPVITALRVTPKSFPASNRSMPLPRKAPARITLTLSEDATITFKVRRKPPARRGGPPPRYLRRFKAQLREGRNSIPFTGKFGELKLKPRDYKLTARARGSLKQPSERVATTFKIVAPR